MTLRGVSWSPLLMATAMGTLILAGCVAFAEDLPPLLYLRLGLAALAGAAAFVLDEPAAAAVDAAPTTLRSRTTARVTVVAVPLAVWVAGVVSIDGRIPQTPAGHLLVEGAGVLAVTVALAAVLRQTGRSAPGEGVATVMGGVVLGLATFRSFPRSVPLFPAGEGWVASTTLWCALGALSVVVVLASTRDSHRRIRTGGAGEVIRPGRT
ncbi:MAG: hypothetical protein ABIW49_11090 [Knoellia sp.]